MNDNLIISPLGLTLQDVVDVARHDRKVSLSPELLDQFAKTKAYLARTIHKHAHALACSLIPQEIILNRPPQSAYFWRINKSGA